MGSRGSNPDGQCARQTLSLLYFCSEAQGMGDVAALRAGVAFVGKAGGGGGTGEERENENVLSGQPLAGGVNH